jgi:ATP synthase assembly factor FMC1
MAAEAHMRSIYRSILRELPARIKALPPSPLRTSIRTHFGQHAASSSPEWQLARRQEAEQFVQYLKAQRVYGTLLERYNPGMSMNEEERVRLTARRVGMDMPEEWYGKK